jgi:hypothetical protein
LQADKASNLNSDYSQRVGCGRISLRCASMSRKIALNSPSSRGMSADDRKFVAIRLATGSQCVVMRG